MSRHGWKNYIRRPDVVERIGSYLGTSFPLLNGLNSVLNVKAVVAAFNQEKALITNLRMELFEALINMCV